MGLNCNPRGESCTFTKLGCWMREAKLFLLFCIYSFWFCCAWSQLYALHADWTRLLSMCWPLFFNWHFCHIGTWHIFEKEKQLVNSKHKMKNKQEKTHKDLIEFPFLWFMHVFQKSKSGQTIWWWTFHQWVFFSSFFLLLRCKQTNTSEGMKASLLHVLYWWIKVALGNGKASVG